VVRPYNQDNPFHTGHGVLPENFVEPPAGFVPEYDRRHVDVFGNTSNM
jgi:hypothetical protein